MATLLSLGPSDLTATPGTSPYFVYDAVLGALVAASSDGTEASLLFNVALPSRFTLDLVVRLPELPNNLGDLANRSCGFTVADDASRGATIYFAKTGIAVSRVDSLGSVTALPDTTDVTEAVATAFHTVRIAVDSTLGRAYVFAGPGVTEDPPLRWIVPVEATPPDVTDTFRLFVHGTPSQPVRLELLSLRLASTLVLANYPPIADAGADRVLPLGQAARLDARGSYDVEGAALTYAWLAIDAPFGSAYAADISEITTTDDGDTDGVTPTISVAAALLPSWIGAGDVFRINAAIYVIASVNLLANTVTMTSDAVPDNIVTAVPARVIRQSLLLEPTSDTPVVVPDISGLYRFQLVVNDGESDSEPTEVLVNTTEAQTPFGIEPRVSALWKALGDEWRSVDGHLVFEEAWRGAAQILSGKLLEAWQYHYNSSIRDAQRVFQRKWVAYRTLETELAPDSVTFGGRTGVLTGTHAFDSGPAATSSTTLRLNFIASGALGAWQYLDIALSATTLPALLTAINAAIGTSAFAGSAVGTGVQLNDATLRYEATCSTSPLGTGTGRTTAVSFTAGSLPGWVAAGDIFVTSGSKARIVSVNNGAGTLVTATGVPDTLSSAPFRIYRACRLTLESNLRFYCSGTAAAVLGLTTARNTLSGSTGARVTDRVYYVGSDVDLGTQGVAQNDLLVLNNGQSFRIDRLLSDPLDPRANQRVLLFDVLPLDATADWEIPSVIRSTQDYEMAGTYPGDIAKLEVYTAATNVTAEATGTIVAQKAGQLAVHFDDNATSALVRLDALRLLGVKRRKAIPIEADVMSVPRLQDIIPVAATPTIWRENVDYIIEPFYRDVGGAALPMLQFRDSVFIDTATEPPDILWAELTLYDNEGNVEDLFGRLVGFMRDDAATFGRDFNYVSGVAGLMYAQQHGPTLFAAQVGAQILLGQPFAEVAGYVEEIREEYSPLMGRILLRDDDGNVPTGSEVVRAYHYRKDPLDTTSLSGLANNPSTEAPWVVGDLATQFSPLGGGISVSDIYNDPTWWSPYARAGLMSEVEKFHTFLVSFNTDLVSVANANLLFSLITRIKPTYTKGIVSGVKTLVADLDVIDDCSATIIAAINDTPNAGNYSFMHDDYRGDGTLASSYNDSIAYYDGATDCPLDLISFDITLAWPGGVTTAETPFDYTTPTLVLDVTGNHVTAGTTFTPILGMTLPAGTYTTTLPIKTKGVVLP